MVLRSDGKCVSLITLQNRCHMLMGEQILFILYKQFRLDSQTLINIRDTCNVYISVSGVTGVVRLSQTFTINMLYSVKSWDID